MIEPIYELNSFYTLLGIDPGTVNFGLAVTSRDAIELYHIKMDRHIDAVDRMREINWMLEGFDLSPHIVVIEGAGFGSSQYRQVELAEVRTTTALHYIGKGTSLIKIVPPNTIRKSVFGSGKTAAHDIFDDAEISRDALAALSCLYYANVLEKELHHVEK